MYIDFASIIYMTLAMYIIGGILIVGLFMLSLWGIKKTLDHLHKNEKKENLRERAIPGQPMAPHPKGLGV